MTVSRRNVLSATLSLAIATTLGGCSRVLSGKNGFRLGIRNYSQSPKRVRVTLSHEGTVFFSQRLYISEATEAGPSTMYTTVDLPAVPSQATIIARAAVDDQDWTVAGINIDCASAKGYILQMNVQESGSISIRDRAACSETLPKESQ